MRLTDSGINHQINLRCRNLRVNDYDGIADAYDEAMGDDFSRIILGPYCEFVRRMFPKPGRPRLLDLGCGTGTFACHFSKRFKSRCIGIDLSRRQVVLARRKARKLGADVAFIRGDVRDTALPKKVDVVTMNLDALNHLTAVKSWSDLFVRIYGSLEPGGLFLFDVNTPRRLLNDWRMPEVTISQVSTYVQCGLPASWDGDCARRRILMQIYSGREHFVRVSNGLIEQIAVPRNVLFGMLRVAGFSKVGLSEPGTRIRQNHIFLKNRWFVSGLRE